MCTHILQPYVLSISKSHINNFLLSPPSPLLPLSLLSPLVLLLPSSPLLPPSSPPSSGTPWRGCPPTTKEDVEKFGRSRPDAPQYTKGMQYGAGTKRETKKEEKERDITYICNDMCGRVRRLHERVGSVGSYWKQRENRHRTKEGNGYENLISFLSSPSLPFSSLLFPVLPFFPSHSSPPLPPLPPL